MKAELFLHAHAELAEGPVYEEAENALYWVDIDGKAIHKTMVETTADKKYETPGRVGALFLTGDNTVYAALEDGVYRQSAEGFIPYAKLPVKPGVRSNDGKCDPEGRIFLGTMAISQEKGKGAFYRITQGQCQTLFDGVSISNGLCFSPDNRYLYYVDTPLGKVWRFDYDRATGEIANRQPVIDYEEEQGAFDGMTIDKQGQLWAAQWNGYRVSAWDPLTGRKTAEISLPVPCVSCCTFGGTGYSDLYITTAKSEGDNLSGAIFVCRDTGVQGMAPYRLLP